VTPIDPPVRVGPTITPVVPAGATIALDRRLSAGSLTVGQEVGARLLSDRAGGRFVALIEGRPVEVVLPQGARSGDTLRLTVTAAQPRLVLSAQGESQAGAGSGAAIGGTALPGVDAAPDPSAARPGPTAGAADVSVSAGARALTRLVADIATAAAEGKAEAGPADADRLPGTRGPLVAVPANDRGALAGQLAAALSRTFAGSGLFYESHQAQWVAGERSLDALRQEPLGTLAPLPPPPPPPLAVAAPRPAASDAPAARLQAPASREPSLPGGAPPSGPPAGAALAGVVDSSTAGLVQQQLAALAAGSAGWSGLVLPGMQARITVQERPRPSEDEQQAEPDAQADWSTRLAVMLPRLGAIDAQLVLRGDRLLVSVAAGDATSAEALSAARQQLVDALAAAGLAVDALQVSVR
jgi:hypothetical protein